MFRNKLVRLMEADTGANGGANTGNANTNEPKTDSNNTTQATEEKTFTQAEVDKMIKERLAREKKNQLPKEELEAYKAWKESQKTEEEKKNEALSNAEKARIAAEEKAAALEAKVTALSKGVKSDSVDDVVILAKALVTDEVTIEQAIDKVLEKYPSFKGEQQESNKGFKIGADIQKQNENTNNALAAIFGNK